MRSAIDVIRGRKQPEVEEPKESIRSAAEVIRGSQQKPEQSNNIPSTPFDPYSTPVGDLLMARPEGGSLGPFILDTLKGPEPPDIEREPSGVTRSFDTGIGEAIRTGAQSSIPGLLARQALPEPYEPQNWIESAAQMMAGYIPDIPFYALGGAVGAGSGGPLAAFTAPAGAIGFVSGVKQTLMDKYSDEEKPFTEKLKDALKETFKGQVVGAALGVAGKSSIGKVPLEITTLATVPKLLEGELPGSKDFLDASIFLGTLKVANISARSFRNVYEKYGKKPTDIAEESVNGELDPEVVRELETEAIPTNAIEEAKAKIKEVTELQEDLTKAEDSVAKNVAKVKGERVRKVKKPEVIVTEKDKEDLTKLGYTEEEITKLTPEEAAEIILRDEPKDRLEIKRTEPTTKEQATKEEKKVEEPEPPKPKPLTKAERNELNRAGHPIKRINQMSIEEAREKLALARGEKVPEPKPINDIDLETGTTEPEELSTHLHPFRDKNPKHTKELSRIYAERVDRVASDPDMMLGKLINDVNKWLNGEEVPIDKVRDGLSEMVTRADEIKFFFDTPEAFNTWKEDVSEAAKWARRAKKGSSGINLNMMIPVNELPARVKEVLKSIRALTKGTIEDYKEVKINELYRNREVWEKTGFWLGKDGKWRYEIDDSKIKIDPSEEVKNVISTKPKSAFLITEIIKYPELFSNVPGLDKVLLSIDKDIKKGGTYDPVKDIITVGSLNNKSSIIHELQHAVNNKVGSKFRGTNVQEQFRNKMIETLDLLRDTINNELLSVEIEDIKNLYLTRSIDSYMVTDRLSQISKKTKYKPTIEEAIDDIENYSALRSYLKDPGEMEARLATARMSMSAEQRREIPPWETLEKMLTSEGLKEESSYTTSGDKITRSVSGPGAKLYSGIPLDEATKAVIKAAKSVSNYTKKARGIKAFKPTTAAKLARESTVRAMIDRSGNIRRSLLNELTDDGYRIIQGMYLARGSSTIAANNLKQMGKEVYGGLSKHLRNILDTLILSERIAAIAKYKTEKDFAFPEGLKPTDVAAYIKLFPYIEGISENDASIIRQRATAYFDWMKKPLEEMHRAGLISDKEFEDLSKHNYRRLSVVENFDKRVKVKVGDRKRTIYDSGIEALAHGKETNIFEPSSEIMALEVFNRAYGRILNNEANLNLLQLARNKEDNPFVRIRQKGKNVPEGWQRFFVYEKGERKPIYLSPEMAKEWVSSSPEVSYKLSQVVRYASGSPVLRLFATGINWGFAMANLPRDVQHIWYAARVFEDGKWKSLYSPHAPIYPLQIGKDMLDVFSDVMLRKGRTIDYIEDGGGMEFLVHQGRLFQRGRHIRGPLDPLIDALGYVGETSELLTRVAIRERVLKRRAKERGITVEEANKDKEIRKEATFAARDYMDFSQGGWLAKSADNGLPYLNAGLQGSRGFFRSFKPGSGTALVSTYKLAQYAGIISGIYLASNYWTPETMQDLKGSPDMSNNLCIPLGDQFGFTDEKGQQRYIYLKIPLDHGQRFFKAFFEGATDKWLGNEVDVDRITRAMKASVPVEIDSLPPTISSTLGYLYNKDFWYNEDIWKKTEALSWPNSQEEYIPGQTPQAYIDFGKMTGMSPERFKASIGELTAGDNMWTWLIGKGYEEIFGDLPKEKKERHLAMVLAKTPIIKRFIGVTNPYSKWAKPIDEATEKAQVERWIQNRGLDELVEGYLFEENTSKKEIVDYAKSFKDPKVYDRLMKDFEFQIATKDLSNRSFWLSLRRISSIEGRAEVFAKRWNKASSEERKNIRKELAIVEKAGGVISEEFLSEAGRKIRE